VSERTKGVCATCGRLAYCDDHHPLGRAHVPGVTISACVRDCHLILNERQAISGMVRDHAVQRGEAEQLWAFVSGLGDVLLVRGFGSTRIGQGKLERELLEIATLGRVVDFVTRSLGEVGIGGPSPRKTDLRVAGRRRSRNPDRSRPHRSAPEPDAATDLEQADQLARTVLGAIASLPLAREVSEAWGLFVTRFSNAYVRLHELADRGREADLFGCLREVDRHREAAITALGEVRRHRDLGQALAPAAAFQRSFGHALSFLADLARADTGDRAEAALDRFQAAVLPN